MKETVCKDWVKYIDYNGAKRAFLEASLSRRWAFTVRELTP